MTNAPYVLPRPPLGPRMGDATLVDVMTHDGLWCAFDDCIMGESSDRNNADLGIERQARTSGRRRATDGPPPPPHRGRVRRGDRPGGGRPAEGRAGGVDTRRGHPGRHLRPTRSPGSARPSAPPARSPPATPRRSPTAPPRWSSPTGPPPRPPGLPILAEILAYGQIAGPDATLHERPAEALRVALKKAELEPADLDLVEINEAFAAVALWSAAMLDLDPATR